MAVLNRVLTGLQIFCKYESSGHFAAEHDEIFAGGEMTKNNMTSEEEKQLEDSGWSWDESLNCFRRYV